MSTKGLNKLGHAVDDHGETVMQMFGPPNAMTEGADGISQCLYSLTELLVRGKLAERCGGGMGGEFGYGADFENDVFFLTHDCQGCDSEECFRCKNSRKELLFKPSGRGWKTCALFWHKQSGLKIAWYKWLGRDMEMNRKSISGKEWSRIFTECWDSIPEKARIVAQKEHDYENTPEFKAERDAAMQRMMEVMMNPEKYGAPIQKTTCSACGKEYEYQDWATRIVSQCDDCVKSKISQAMTAPWEQGQ